MRTQALDRLVVAGTDESVLAAYRTLGERSAGASFSLFEEEVVSFDCETTGFDPRRCSMIEIAAVVVRGGRIVDEMSTFIDPGAPIPDEIVRLTGIDDSMVAGAPSAAEAMERLVAFVGDRDIVAHNASFDRSFVEAVIGPDRLPGAWVDTLALSRIALPRLRKHRLTDLAEVWCTRPPAHRALDDAVAVAELWPILLTALSDLPTGLLHTLATLSPATPWALRPTIAAVAGASVLEEEFDLRTLRAHQVSIDAAPARPDAFDEALDFPSPERITEAFTPEGIVGRMYPGYEPRPEQMAMAQEILSSFRTSTHRAIEAGTGVGKSVGYLVPAALVARDNGVTMGVATKTNALMDQLVYHELPKLSASLPTPLRFTSLKGYDRYPCLRKVEALSRTDEPLDEELLVVVAVLLAWTAQSTWGDLDTVNVYWAPPIRREVTSTPAECLRRRCRFYRDRCYVHGTRARAHSADIVVTNHALLFRSLAIDGGMLPPIRHWVIDEAHAVESEARRQLALAISWPGIGLAFDTVHGRRGGATTLIKRAAKNVSGAATILPALERLEGSIDKARSVADLFFEAVKRLSAVNAGGAYDTSEIRIAPDLRESHLWGDIDAAGTALSSRLSDVLALAREAISATVEFEDDLAEGRARLIDGTMRITEAYEALVTILDGFDPGYVYTASVDRRVQRRVESLAAIPYDIGDLLVERLFSESRSVIFTSATIAAGESFEHFRRSVGMDRLDSGSCGSLQLASGYDFESNMGVYVPRDMPAPNAAGYHAALEDLLFQVHRAMGGSTLTLFTNRRDMELMYKALKHRLQAEGIELLHQARGTSARSLRDEFLADHTLSLFALRSFWEGFDAPGDTLRCVVVPKLPFGLPTDPLAQERESREENAWRAYSLPEAVIDLKQAAGRLIRSSSDTGCLVLADSRLVTKSYGRTFLAAMPTPSVVVAPAADVVADIERRFGRGRD